MSQSNSLNRPALTGDNSFKEMLQSDLYSVFLNPLEFGELRTIEYDGNFYENVPVVIRAPRHQDRHQMAADNAQSLYQAGTLLHVALADIGGIQPEKDKRIWVHDPEGFPREYYIEESFVEVGLCHLTLEAIDE